MKYWKKTFEIATVCLCLTTTNLIYAQNIAAQKPNATQTRHTASAKQTPTAQKSDAKNVLFFLKNEQIFESLGYSDEWIQFVKTNIDENSVSYPVRRYLEWLKRYDDDIHARPQTPIPGSITSFYVSFPYECPSILDYRHAFTPEQTGFDTSETCNNALYPALNWMLYESIGNSSAVMPQERMYHPGFVVMYLSTRIVLEADKPIRATLEIPSATPITAWLGSKRVLEHLENSADFPPLYAERREILLQPGENILTLKVGALESQPAFYVFLSDAETGKPLDFKIDNANPIRLSTPLESEISSVSRGSIVDPSNASDLTDAERALLARLFLSSDDAQRIINNLLLNDIEATAQWPTPDIAVAVLALQDPGKSLQILRNALHHSPDDPTLNLLYARELILNSEAQGDTGSRFVDEFQQIQNNLQKFHQNRKNIEDSQKNTAPNSLDYSPLREKIIAMTHLNAHQVATAIRNWDKNIDDTSLYPLISAHLESRGQIAQYNQILDKLYAHQKNSAVYLTDRLDRQLQNAVSSNNSEQLLQTLIRIQNESQDFLSRHPYDDTVWNFWLDVISAYGASSVSADSAPNLESGFSIDVESQFLLYLSQRMNDPARWLRFARYCMEIHNMPEAVSAYEMAAKLKPQDESLAEIANLIKKWSGGNSTASQEQTSAYETPYIVKDIPKNESKDASQFVSLLDNRVVRILPNGLASTFNQIAFEVLDEQGLKSLRAMPINYSPSDEKLEIISVTTTKKDGSIHKLYKTTEYNTADESIRMYYDQRQLVIEIPDLAIGDRVEYRFKRTQMQKSASSANYFSDIFQLQASFVRQWAKYTVITPKDFPVKLYRHDPNGTSQYVGSSHDDGEQTITTYEIKTMPRLMQEDRMPGITEVAPFLLASSFRSWQDVTNWFLDLAIPQWKPDDAIKNAVRELTQNIDDPLEKLKKIHSFVVKSTRYVALEFGIHGHKPYPVSQVFERRFGDCKDKASLLKVMLDEAGIKTQFVLVRTRKNGDIAMEPNAYLFDHAIVYVPQFDLFLDGTAEFSGTTELPALDQGANVLIIDDNANYQLVKTPMSKAQDNISNHEWTFDLTQNNRISYTDHASYKGLMAPSYRERYQVESLRKERLESEYAYTLPGTAIDDFTLSDMQDLEKDVAITVKASTAFSEIVKKDGRTWLLKPAVRTSNMAQMFAPSAKRQFPLEQISPMTFKTTVHFILPPNANVTLPDASIEHSLHGHWEIHYQRHDDILSTTLEIALDQSKISPDQYASYQDFLQRFDRAANTPLRITFEE